jgi:hypothetical protein
MIKQGSRWSSGDHKMFVVLHTIEQDGHTWVHYRDADGNPPKEYSCYQESFVQRFNEILNDSRS